MPGQPYAGGVGQSGGVPSWALILVGVLIGFLVAMSLFKFTSMGAALRGDLVEEGKAKAEKMYKAKIKSLEDGGYPDDEEEDEPEEEPEEEEPEEEPEPDEEPEPEEEDKEEEDTEEE